MELCDAVLGYPRVKVNRDEGRDNIIIIVAVKLSIWFRVISVLMKFHCCWLRKGGVMRRKAKVAEICR